MKDRVGETRRDQSELEDRIRNVPDANSERVHQRREDGSHEPDGASCW